MFLTFLNWEKKKLFLDLCKYAALSDNFFSTRQRLIIELYSNEMGFSNIDLEKTHYDLDYILENLANNCTKYEKKEIIVEIIALLLSNDKIDPSENDFLVKVAKSFEIGDKKLEEMVAATHNLIRAQSKLKKSMD